MAKQRPNGMLGRPGGLLRDTPASINRIAVLVEGYTLIRDIGVYTISDTSIPELLQGHPQGAIIVHRFFLLDSA